MALVPEIVLHTTMDFGRLWEEYAGTVTTGDQLPFWSVAWPGGQVVARYLLDHPEVAAERTVLDLGAGSGICGIAAAMTGGCIVTASDVDACARLAIEINAAANRVHLVVTGEDMLELEPPAVDVVLVGDLFYDRVLAHRLLPWLDRAAGRGSTILVGDASRVHAPSDRLQLLAEYTVSGLGDIEGTPTVRASVSVLAP